MRANKALKGERHGNFLDKKAEKGRLKLQRVRSREVALEKSNNEGGNHERIMKHTAHVLNEAAKR